MSRSLRSRSLRASRKSDDMNPMDGVANLADIMLVLACGLMTALIVNWNVDIGLKPVDVTKGQEVTQAEELQKDVTNAGKGYEEMGVLYKDPVTGKMYILAQDEG